MALKTAATSFVVSALLVSPRAGEAFRPFALRGVRMVSATIPSHGMSGGTINIPTSGSTNGGGAAQVLSVPREQQKKRSAASSRNLASNFSGETPHDTGIRHSQYQQHPASAFYFAGEGTAKPPPAAQLAGTPAQRDQLPLSPPPEPGGAAGKDAFQSAYSRPWRKRARDARRGTVFENTEGFLSEGVGEGGGGDSMRQRASEKEEVVASRRQTQKKALSGAALPIVDLVGIVSPLVIILGMSIAQNVP